MELPKSLCLSLLLFQFVLCLGCLDQERNALLVLKNSFDNKTRSGAFDGWVGDEGTDCCSWEGVRCNHTTNRVVLLNLYDSADYQYLNASLFLPFEDLRDLNIQYPFTSWRDNEGLERLSELKKLTVLRLGMTMFNASLFLSLSKLTSLTSLVLHGSFSEKVSSSELSQGFKRMSNLKKLENLEFTQSKFDVDMLPIFGSLSALKTLDLSENYNLNESPELPKGWTKMGSLKNLKALSFNRNFLTGSLSEICELMYLRELDLSYNSFEGTIPPCLSNLTNLRMLDLSNNKHSGKIPPSLTFSNCRSLRLLELSNNQLSGTIYPSLIHNLTQLEYISFSNNLLEGNPLLTSLKDGKFQLIIIGLSNCNLHLSATELSISLHSQFSLEHIDFSHNSIYGKYPTWLAGNNSRLKALLLSNNSLSGHIHFPSHLPRVLENLDISSNHIEGNLQQDFGDVLPRVRSLNLSKNSLEGSIPPSLGNTTNLSWLDLSNNYFSGEIPGDLGFYSRISYLLLSNNRLKGRIPYAIFNTSELTVLSLSNNKFTGFSEGGINGTISHFRQIIDISQNDISGRIPTWVIGDFESGGTLVLGDNHFNGPIPTQICQLSHLEYLDLSQNQLSGPIPSCLNLTYMTFLHLKGNKLSGELPLGILNSKYLSTLDLGDNYLSGGIPNWLGLLGNLRAVLLGRNLLEGVIPHKLCNLKNLGLLDLSHNHFSGSIPPCFNNITFGMAEAVGRETGPSAEGLINRYSWDGLLVKKDFSFDWGGNFLYVEKVEFITKSRSDSYKGNILNFMSGIDLSCNHLSGEIPQEIGALTALRALNLSHNQFTGSIPKKFSKLKNIESMDLSYNKLSGEIPSELSTLNYMAVFLVSHNNLSGRLPDMKGQFSTFNQTSYEGNPFLCGPPLQKQCNTTITEGYLITRTAEKLGIDPISFMASCAASYVMTLSGIVIILFINRYWRGLWFEFVDKCLSFLFPSWSKFTYKGYNRRR